MDLKTIVPLVIYDNQCYLCTKFAKVVNFFARGKILMVGHYSELGKKLRDEILDSSALEMFWHVDGKTAWGGRAAIFPLIKTILFTKRKANDFSKIQESCNTDCKTVKGVFVRSASLLTNSKKISI